MHLLDHSGNVALATVILYSIALVCNCLLVYLSCAFTAKTFRGYSVIIRYNAIIQIGMSVATLLSLSQVVPTGFSFLFISFGPCRYVSDYLCYALSSYTMCSMSHMIPQICLSFAYRLYVLSNRPPTARTMTTVWIVIFSITVMQYICMLSAPAPIENLLTFLPYIFPLEDFTTTTLGLSGLKRFRDGVNVSFAVSWLCIPIFPGYILMMIFRKMIINKMKENSHHLTKTTLEGHKKLLKALSLQALLPMALFIPIVLFLMDINKVYLEPFLEQTMFLWVSVIPLMEPIITIYYVTPYQKAVRSMLNLTKSSKQPPSVVMFGLAQQTQSIV